ncbi:MAG: class I SAM-dependent methyltransferase [Oceanospirillaceae bacterium]|nr:class I SAM-dependent methyltransferase [Oceanospirillaceae bacterium]
MKKTQEFDHNASLEALVETGMLRLNSLHPGGLALTRELAELCYIQKGAKVLDVASGTGETACFFAERFAARAYGVDRSDQMIRRATAQAQARGLKVQFSKADAARLPFADGEFDAVTCECTLCFLEKAPVLNEMVRVVRPGGCIGIHDLCWQESAPNNLKLVLAEIEGEKPETLEGWGRLLGDAGLVQIKAIDKSTAMSRWMQDSKRQLGLLGQLQLAFRVIRRWGLSGLWKVLQSERVFSSKFLGYGIVIGTRP